MWVNLPPPLCSPKSSVQNMEKQVLDCPPPPLRDCQMPLSKVRQEVTFQVPPPHGTVKSHGKWRRPISCPGEYENGKSRQIPGTAVSCSPSGPRGPCRFVGQIQRSRFLTLCLGLHRRGRAKSQPLQGVKR